MQRHSSPLRRSSALLFTLFAMSAGGALAAACSISAEVDGVFQEDAQGSGGSPTGTTTGTGATGTGAGGSGTGGGTGGPERCDDGVDNDGDGMTDCEDADCQPGFECVDAAPDGWDGYFQLQRTAFPGPAPVCPDGGTPDTYFSGPAGPAECSACSCGPIQGGSCLPPPIECFGGSTTCTGQGADWTAQLADGQCHKPPLTGITGLLSCHLTGPAQADVPGSCEPSPVDFPNKDTWQQQVAACGGSPGGGGCAGGQVCVPKPQDQEQSTCIRHEGATSCPAGWTTSVEAFSGGADTRGCTDCACGDGTTCAGGLYTFYDGNGCSNGNSPPVAIDSTNCANVSPLLDFSSWGIRATLPQPGGACPASGGEPAGEVQTEGRVTFCCR